MIPENLKMFHDTMAILNNGYYQLNEKKVTIKLTKEQMKEISVFLPEDVYKICNAKDFQAIQTIERPMEVSCQNIDSWTLAIKRTQERALISEKASKPVLVLNLANAVQPGGGVRRGLKAQEEDLCRKSSLLISLESDEASKYYKYNKSLNTDNGSDAIMITPQVEIIKDEHGNLLEDSVIVAVMTCAAPRFYPIPGKTGVFDQQYLDMVYKRIVGMIKLAAYFGYEDFILGAFGCGAFFNDPQIISDLFYKAFKELDCCGMNAESFFRRIDFAVLSSSDNSRNYKEFSRNFNHYYEQKNAKNSSGFTFFWKDNEKNGEFSNWYRCEFTIDDFCYSCVEQYMMSQKAKLFHDAKHNTAILRANTPKECKALGQKVTPYDSKAWGAVKYEIVKKANREKYLQNPDLMKQLLSTGDTIMAEASPKDTIWGIGMDAKKALQVGFSNWPGQNLLGKILMELREEFRKE